jgi:hypothetical protein
METSDGNTNQGNDSVEANADVEHLVDSTDGHQDMITDTTVEHINIFGGLQDSNEIDLNLIPSLPLTSDRPCNHERHFDAVVPMDMDTSTKKLEKGKEKEVSPVEAYKELRTKLKSMCAERAIELLDYVDDARFEVKDLFVLLSKNDFEKTFEFVKSINNIKSDPSLTEDQRQENTKCASAFVGFACE